MSVSFFTVILTQKQTIWKKNYWWQPIYIFIIHSKRKNEVSQQFSYFNVYLRKSHTFQMKSFIQPFFLFLLYGFWEEAEMKRDIRVFLLNNIFPFITLYSSFTFFFVVIFSFPYFPSKKRNGFSIFALDVCFCPGANMSHTSYL